jgi:hypothetical protein
VTSSSTRDSPIAAMLAPNQNHTPVEIGEDHSRIHGSNLCPPPGSSYNLLRPLIGQTINNDYYTYWITAEISGDQDIRVAGTDVFPNPRFGVASDV